MNSDKKRRLNGNEPAPGLEPFNEAVPYWIPSAISYKRSRGGLTLGYVIDKISAYVRLEEPGGRAVISFGGKEHTMRQGWVSDGMLAREGSPPTGPKFGELPVSKVFLMFGYERQRSNKKDV
jgi:hypothetical protein